MVTPKEYMEAFNLNDVVVKTIMINRRRVYLDSPMVLEDVARVFPTAELTKEGRYWTALVSTTSGC